MTKKNSYFWHILTVFCYHENMGIIDVENASDNITQADVAGHVSISTFYFSKLFKQYMHMSFPAYLANIRVKSAASLPFPVFHLGITEN